MRLRQRFGADEQGGDGYNDEVIDPIEEVDREGEQ